MTTELDIIDTAVKIGLGALITGVVTYAVTHKNQKFELKKQIIQDKKELLLDVTRKIDRSGAIKNDAMQSLNVKRYGKKHSKHEITEEFLLLGDAANELKAAGTNCYLIGEKELGDLIEKLFFELDQFSGYIFQHGLEYDNEKLDDFSVRRQALMGKIRARYKGAFDDLHT